MPERESTHPDLKTALRAYEVEMRDGTERSQKAAFEKLRAVQRRLGSAAVVAADTTESTATPTDKIEPRLAAG